MKILLVDTSLYYPSSPMFAEALKELADEGRCDFEFFDDVKYHRKSAQSLLHKVAYRCLGRRPLTYWAMNRALVDTAVQYKPDMVLVVKGPHVSPDSLRRIKAETKAQLINFATDDPFNPRNSTRDLMRSIPLYDLYVSTKRVPMDDMRRAGAQRVLYVPFGYKPQMHYRELPQSDEERAKFCSDVTFIGGCDSDRIPYFERLIQAHPGINLHLYGGYWDRHPTLRPYHRGFAIGREFRLATGGAKISINLVRKANRDGHVMRTFEVPACGGFMLGDRTAEHLDLFAENQEAAYFDSAEEMSEKVSYYLTRSSERQQIAEAGCVKALSAGYTYRDRVLTIMNSL